jgi:hypothetical protein
VGKQLYRFQIQRDVSPSVFAAVDGADQSNVWLIEVAPRPDRYEEDSKELEEIANRLGCETFSAGVYTYAVAKSEAQTSQLVRQLQSQGLFQETAADRPPKKRRHVVPVVVAACLLIAAAVAVYVLTRPLKTVLRLEGSTTIGDELALRLLVGFLKNKGAKDIQEIPVSDKDKTHHDVRAKLPGQWRPVIFSVVANGSGNSFKALHDHHADIGMASRPINDKEVQLLANEGNMRSPCCENIIALDGLAIIVNDSNTDVQEVGFSSAMPVGDNSTVEGREKNRRVEIWSK